jgi:hypothetical protein
MTERKERKSERISNAFVYADFGDASLLIIGLTIFFSLPWTLFRLARLSWHIESKQGQTDHHKRIAGILLTYLVFWGIGIALAIGGYFLLIGSYGN